MPSCTQVTVCASRKEALLFEQNIVKKKFPLDYKVLYPISAYSWPKVIDAIANISGKIPTFSATEKSVEFVSSWLKEFAGNKKIVSITLREQQIHQQRNSAIGVWGDFARKIQAKGFCPVFMRDTSVALSDQPKELDDFLIFKEGPWNMELRMALYELSHINMFVNNGPAILAHYNKKTHYLMFIKKQQGVFEVSDEHFEAEGIPNGQMPGATPFQQTVWQEDTFENLVNAFDSLNDKINCKMNKQ